MVDAPGKCCNKFSYTKQKTFHLQQDIVDDDDDDDDDL
jgi:hypothetical protein